MAGSPSAYPNSPSTAAGESHFETPVQIKEARQQRLNEIHRHGVRRVAATLICLSVNGFCKLVLLLRNHQTANRR